MTYRIGVVQLPGSNCERETKLALRRADLVPVDVLWFDPIEKLQNCDGFVIVGGFSYEDRCRSGAIAVQDNIIQALIAEAKKGKPILGLCNGAQILVESGLVPGCVDDTGELKIVMALTHNRRLRGDKVVGTGYYNAWCRMRSQNTPTLEVPIAHAEGRFVLSDDLYALLEKSKVTCWQYVDWHNQVVNSFPVNPNGSYKNLAAVGNFSGNVLAMMPHPERTTQGDFVFTQMRKYLETKKPFQWITKISCEEKSPQPPFEKGGLNEIEKSPPPPFKKGELDEIEKSPPPPFEKGGPGGIYNQNTMRFVADKYSNTYFIKLGIADNEAISVEMALKQQGIHISVIKYRFWGLQVSENDLKKIEDSFELWNPQKEIAYQQLPGKNKSQSILVTDVGDTTALHKMNILKQNCQVTTLSELTTGVVWQLVGEELEIKKAIDCHLLANPVSQTCQFIMTEVSCPA